MASKFETNQRAFHDGAVVIISAQTTKNPSGNVVSACKVRVAMSSRVPRLKTNLKQEDLLRICMMNYD